MNKILRKAPLLKYVLRGVTTPFSSYYIIESEVCEAVSNFMVLYFNGRLDNKKLISDLIISWGRGG